jgi:hypothetical protein
VAGPHTPCSATHWRAAGDPGGRGGDGGGWGAGDGGGVGVGEAEGGDGDGEARGGGTGGGGGGGGTRGGEGAPMELIERRSGTTAVSSPASVAVAIATQLPE